MFALKVIKKSSIIIGETQTLESMILMLITVIETQF